jgi:formylglycine-generating enzyme required for sulfatase activity/tRNA A-37 threonylcarbamoyl transferase component Bud32
MEPETNDTSEERMRRSFAMFVADRARGELRPLSDYLTRCEGDDLDLARAYVAVRRQDRGFGDRPACGALFGERYEVVREIGRGGQGAVYQATDLKLRRKVALKVLAWSGANDDEAALRFRREGEIASKLEHPGICPVFDVGVEAGAAYIAMQFVEGETWASRIAACTRVGDEPSTFATSVDASSATTPETPSHARSSPPSTRAQTARVAAIAETVARTLNVAHERGVVHRDVKPGNIMIGRDDAPVILDFGLAHELDPDGAGLTRTGEVLGTPAYLSPEQLSGKRERIDRRTDVYGLGASLFEALALRKPFSAPTRQALFRTILSEPPPDLRRLNPAVSKDLATVVAVALEKSPDRRYQTALDFAEDLRRAAAGEAIRARPARWAVRTAGWAKRNPALAGALVAVVLSLAGGLAVALHLLNTTQDALSAKSRAVLDFESLSDMKRCRDLAAEAAGLFPTYPSKIPALTAWLERGRRLVGEIGRHEAELAGLEASHMGARSDSAAWRIEYLRELTGVLRAFADPDPRKGALADVEQRLRFAESVRRTTIDDHAARWDAAVRSIANPAECPRYGGLRIVPQLGLVPLGRRADTGLWEFADVSTGEIPATDGVVASYAYDERTAVILVLLPGGAFQMGTDTEDGTTFAFEAPHRVLLRPYFIAKSETTQGQWLRATGSNPGFFQPGSKIHPETTLLHPATDVTWTQCAAVARRLNLALPTEAQWEFACRAGTTTEWHFGDEPSDLEDRANVADLSLVNDKRGRYGMAQVVDWDDGFAIHAPVTAFPPNAFGLLGFHGNVSEWCRDLWCATPPPDDRTPGDGAFPGGDGTDRATRDGNWLLPAENARCARRTHMAPDTATPTYGCRFARPLYAAGDPAGS